MDSLLRLFTRWVLSNGLRVDSTEPNGVCFSTRSDEVCDYIKKLCREGGIEYYEYDLSRGDGFDLALMGVRIVWVSSPVLVDIMEKMIVPKSWYLSQNLRIVADEYDLIIKSENVTYNVSRSPEFKNFFNFLSYALLKAGVHANVCVDKEHARVILETEKELGRLKRHSAKRPINADGVCYTDYLCDIRTNCAKCPWFDPRGTIDDLKRGS